MEASNEIGRRLWPRRFGALRTDESPFGWGVHSTDRRARCACNGHSPGMASTAMVAPGRGFGVCSVPLDGGLRFLHRGRNSTTIESPALAPSRLPLSSRRENPAAARWRRQQDSLMARPAPLSGLGPAAFCQLRNASLRAETESDYGAGWQRFVRFCSDGGYRPLRARISTVGAYVGCLADKGTCQPQTISTYLAPVRKRHLAAGLPSPTDHYIFREAFSGARNEWLERAGAGKPRRCALPSRVA